MAVSGRNAGHCTPTFTHYSLPELRTMLGAPWAERLIERQTQANDRVSSMIRDYQIDCEWVQNGYVMGAPYKGALAGLDKKVETYNAVGARTRVLDRDEVEAMTGSPRFHGGWLHEEGGHLNPLGYARGLARAVMQEGGVIHTGSAVIACDPQSDRRLVREDGQGRGDRGQGDLLHRRLHRGRVAKARAHLQDPEGLRRGNPADGRRDTQDGAAEEHHDP